MNKTKLCALLFAAVLAGASIVPVATCAAKGEVGEPPLPPDDGSGEVGEPPLPPDDDPGDTGEDNPGEEDTTKPVDYDVLFEEAKASIANRDKTAALKAAINAVDEQIPNWNIWKYVPYAMEQVQNGNVCMGANRISVGCRKTGVYMPNLIIQNLIPPENGITMDPGEEYWQQPEVAKLAKMTLPQLLEYARSQSLYTSDDEFRTLIDMTQVEYDEGMNTLRASLTKLSPDASGIEFMSSKQLVAALLDLPEATLYGIDSFQQVDDGLYSRYANAYSWIYVMSLEDASTDYANLVVAATKVNPEFSVNLADVPVITPSAPNTGSAGSEVTSGILAKVALTTVAVITFVAGALVTAKRYAFSPLKRK